MKLTIQKPMCPCRKWQLYVGTYDRHGHTQRCVGCLRIPAECKC